MASMKQMFGRLKVNGTDEYVKIGSGTMRMELVDKDNASESMMFWLIRGYQENLQVALRTQLHGRQSPIYDNLIFVHNDGTIKIIDDEIRKAKATVLFNVILAENKESLRSISQDYFYSIIDKEFCFVSGNISPSICENFPMAEFYSFVTIDSIPSNIGHGLLFDNGSDMQHIVSFESKEDMLVFKMSVGDDVIIDVQKANELKTQYELGKKLLNL